MTQEEFARTEGAEVSTEWLQSTDRVGAEGVLALRNDYAEAQVEAIEANGGHVFKFIGDGLLAIFTDDQENLRAGARRGRRAAPSQRSAQRAPYRIGAAGDGHTHRVACRRASLRQRG